MGLGSPFEIFLYLFKSGGWTVFVFVGFYLIWLLMVEYNQLVYLTGIKWTFLSIDIPKENEQTFLAVEQIFAQLHAIHANYTFGEKYFHGQMVLWMSMEIVSFGGQVKYIVKIPQKFRNLLESAVYAQYPNAEIREVEDYIKNLPQFEPGKSYYDVFGCEFKLKKDDAYPIRTYKAFEHQASQIIVDPLAGILEALSSIKPHEFMAVQYLLRPTDDDWKDEGRELVNELIGMRKEKHEPNFIQSVGSGVLKGLGDIFSGPAVETKEKTKKEEPPSMMQHLSPGTKDVVAAIEESLGKIGYKTKIRIMYLAPKEKFSSNTRSALVGSFRQFDDINLNGLKPDTKKTWTGIHFKFSERLEKPFIDYLVERRKRRMVMFFKSRSFSKGRKSFVLNIEELATLFHFPLSETVKVPQLTKTEIKKGEAPINLPIQE